MAGTTNHDGENWPYHEDPHGNMVPCESNPCSLHGGKDVMATSAEQAEAIKHANVQQGLSAQSAQSTSKTASALKLNRTYADDGLARDDKTGKLTDDSVNTIITRLTSDDNNKYELNPDDYDDITMNHKDKLTNASIYSNMQAAVDRFIQNDTRSIIASNDNSKNWTVEKYNIPGHDKDDYTLYSMPSKSTDNTNDKMGLLAMPSKSTDDKMGLLVMTADGNVSFSVYHQDETGQWVNDDGRVSVESKSDYDNYKLMHNWINKDVNNYAFIASIPRQSDDDKVQSDALAIEKMKDSYSDLLKSDVDYDDNINESYYNMVLESGGDYTSMGIYSFSSASVDEDGNSYEVSLNDYDMSTKECELLAIDNQRDCEDSVIWNLPSNRMSTLMHNDKLRAKVIHKLMSSNELNYENYEDMNVVESIEESMGDDSDAEYERYRDESLFW